MTTSENNTPDPIARFAANRGTAGLILMAIGVALAAGVATLVAKIGSDFLLLSILGGALALLFLVVGVMVRHTPASAGEGPAINDLVRIYLLSLGGVAGLLIALMGLALHYYWWNDLTDWLRLGNRDRAWHVLVALAVLIAGLAIMFVSLQVVRSAERTSAVLRRMVYGYNAVLTGLLLLLILTVVNVLVGLKFTGVIDATQSGQFTLSEPTTNVLKGLTQPVHIYVIWPTDDEYLDQLKSLLGNFQDANPRIKVEYLSPLHDRNAVLELTRKYKGKLEERYGVLLVQGDETPENATFLKPNDLFTEEGFGPAQSTKFRGEDKLVATLAGASGAKGKTIVYVTQGAGEPDLNDVSQREADKGLGTLKDRLNQRGNLDIRPLKLNPAEPKVPDDCNVLIVANPKAPVSVALDREIRDYVTGPKKGKAIFLLDVSPSPDDKVVPPTGLERLLGEFGVEVSNTFVVTILEQGNVVSPEDVAICAVNDSLGQSGNELARAFAGRALVLPSARAIRPSPTGTPAYRVEPLLQTSKNYMVWTENDPSANLVQKLRTVLSNPTEAKRVLAQDQVTAALLVTEASPVPPMPGTPPPNAKPRLVVFGDTTFLTNPYASERAGRPNVSFFASTIDWLAERSSSFGVESKSLPIFALDPSAAERSTRMYFLPLVLSLVGIIGLGAGVWVVRRR
jgi:hypothetical protein